MHWRVTILPLLAAWISTCPVQGDTIGFDTSDDIADLLTLSGYPARASYSASGGAGTPPGGALAINDGNSEEQPVNGWRKEVYPVNGAQSLRTSILMNFAGITKEEAQVGIGFVHSTSPPATTEKDWLKKKGAGQYLSAHFKYKRKDNKYELLIGNKAGSGEGSELGKVEVNTSQLSNWLRLSLELVPTTPGGNAFAVTLRLEDLGPDGTSEPTTLRTIVRSSETNAALAQNESVYAAFNLMGKKTNQTFYLDDHYAKVVPAGAPASPTAEPATHVTGGSFNANWSAPFASIVDGYRLEVSADDEFTSFIGADGSTGNPSGITLPSGTTRQRIENLPFETPYWYRVAAFNEQGDGEFSEVVTVTTLAEGVNASPTMDTPVFPVTRVSPNSGPYIVPLTGITDGGEGDQTLIVTAVSADPNIAYVFLDYTPNETTGQLRVHGGSQEGVTTVTVTVDDGQDQVSKDIPVNVAPVPLTFGFDAPGDIDAELTLHSNASLASHSGTGGVSGGGALAINDGGSEEQPVNGWRKEVYKAKDAESLRTSILVNFAGTTKEEAQVGIGFVHSAGPPATNEKDWLKKKGAGQYLSAHLKYKRKDNKYELLVGNKSSTSSDGSELGKVEVSTPQLSNWLRLSLDLVRILDGNTFEVTLRLEDLGTDGTSEPALMRSIFVPATINAALAQSESTYAGFNLMGKKTGQTFYVDDHFAEVVHPNLGPVLTLEYPLNYRLHSGYSSVNFGSLPGDSSSYRELVIRNAGSVALTRLTAEASGAAAASVVVGTPSSTTILPGEIATLGVTFHSGGSGPLPPVLLRVTSAETINEPFEVVLSADWLTAVQPGLSLSANPNVSLGRKLGVSGTDFGRSGGALAVSGNLAVVGSDAGDGGGGALPGTVSIHDLATGALVRNITPPENAGPEFGRSVAVFGNYIAIGSPLEGGTGAVYVFNAATGAQISRAVPPPGESGSRFGQSVGINANVLAVGDPSESGQGAAYLYNPNSGGFLNYVLPSVGLAGQEFGTTLVVDGGQVLVGAPGESGGGAVYLFEIFDSSQISRFASVDGSTDDRFGAALALDAQRIAVGAPGRYSGRGAIFLFSRTTLQRSKELLSSDTVAGDAFGSSVALTSHGVLVGAAKKGAGAVYLLNLLSGAGIYRITATDGASGDGFGGAVAAAGNQVLVGAPTHGGGGMQRGGVYTLRFPPYQPDGTVGATSVKQAGRGIHNPSGASQTLNLVSKKLRKVKGVVTATNDGLATDSLLVRGTAGNKQFKVAYFTASGPRANVTAAMSKGGTVLANLASGEVRHYSVEIAPQKKALQKKKKNGKQVILKKKYNGRVTLASQNAPAKTDVVLYRVQTK